MFCRSFRQGESRRRSAANGIRHRKGFSRRIEIERLEDRRLLSVNTLWIEQIGGSASDQSLSLSADGLGDVYISGSTSGNLDGTNAGGIDAFVSKFDSAGSLLWTRQFGSSSDESGYSVSADNLGNVYVTGTTEGTLVGSSAGGDDAFVSKYNANGTLQWTRQLGTTGDDGGIGAHADGLGNVYITGVAGGNLGGSYGGSEDAFLSKYDSGGTLLWTKQLGTSGDERSYGVTTDGLGYVYISGLTAGNLGGTNAGGKDVFISKYGTSGTHIWTKQFGTGSDEASHGASADGLGNVYISGFTAGSLGSANVGDYDSFVCKVDINGT
jgi:hypothetical protein